MAPPPWMPPSAACSPAALAGFTKTGPGVLSLTNANNYTGSTTVADGVLRLQNATALPSGNLELTGGGVLGLGAGDLTARTIGTGTDQVQWLGSGGFAAFGATRAVKFSATSINWTATDFIGTGRVLILSHDTADATLDWQQPISLAGYLRFVQVEDGSAAIDAKMSGVIAGGSSGTSVNIFNKTGAGTLAFTAQNTYWGETIINSGTLMIGDGGTTGGISQNTPIITVEPGAMLAVNRSDTVTQGTNPFKVAVTGDGGFTQAGSGNTVLMLANTYIGPTTLDAGTLTLGAAGVLPDASEVSIGNATLAAGSFSETAGRLDITGTATLKLGTGATLVLRRQQRGGLDRRHAHPHRHLRFRLVAPFRHQQQRPDARPTRPHHDQRKPRASHPGCQGLSDQRLPGVEVHPRPYRHRQ